LALAVFAVLLAAMYVRSAVFYVHPLLLLAGLHIYEATTVSGRPITLITRRRHLTQNARLFAVTVAPAVYAEGRHS
ncbi:MAG: hypothetical protein JO147_07125, partial [Actinobacteria bacterium]|nr:hypothetical protein [Actinomycetota bacterium]